MAKNSVKSAPFFVRANIDCAATSGTYDQAPIDLGFAVDALGATIVRLHSVQADFSVQGASNGLPYPASAGDWGQVSYQLTTQSKTDLVYASDKSLVTSGKLAVAMDTNNDPVLLSAESNRIDLSLNEGYLIGVETMYLGIIGTLNSGAFIDEPRVDVILEFTVESMTSAKAIALSLSQQ